MPHKHPPRVPPERGDRVRLRGRDATGVLKTIGSRGWACVDWDVVGAGPRFVHLGELERV